MKKLILFLTLSIAFVSCKKDEEQDVNDNPNNAQSYAQRLSGNWSLTAVKYEGLIPSPFGNIELDGEGTALSGGHTIGNNPNTIDYNYSFSAEVDFNGSAIPLPVTRDGLGEFTISSDDTQIFITEDGETVIWKVLVNESNKQVYEAELTESFNGLAIVIDTELTFER